MARRPVQEVGRGCREPLGTQRVRRAALGIVQRAPEDPAERPRLTERHQPAEGALGVGDGRVDENAAARVVLGPGVDPFGQARRAVAALQRNGADEQVRQGVQRDKPAPGQYVISSKAAVMRSEYRLRR